MEATAFATQTFETKYYLFSQWAVTFDEVWARCCFIADLDVRVRAVVTVTHTTQKVGTHRHLIEYDHTILI